MIHKKGIDVENIHYHNKGGRKIEITNVYYNLKLVWTNIRGYLFSKDGYALRSKDGFMLRAKDQTNG